VSDDVDFVNVGGDWMHGKPDFELYHTRLLAGPFKHSTLEVLDAAARFIRKADTYGGTSLVFPPQTLFTQPDCSPTFSNGGARFRSSTLLSAYRDFVFRERGACIHSFLQVNPNSLNAGAGGRSIAVENASVFPLGGTIDR
jgi:hypothetical protein